MVDAMADTTSPCALQLRDVHKSFGVTPIIRGVTLDVQGPTKAECRCSCADAQRGLVIDRIRDHRTHQRDVIGDTQSFVITRAMPKLFQAHVDLRARAMHQHQAHTQAVQ